MPLISWAALAHAAHECAANIREIEAVERQITQHKQYNPDIRPAVAARNPDGSQRLMSEDVWFKEQNRRQDYLDALKETRGKFQARVRELSQALYRAFEHPDVRWPDAPASGPLREYVDSLHHFGEPLLFIVGNPLRDRAIQDLESLAIRLEVLSDEPCVPGATTLLKPETQGGGREKCTLRVAADKVGYSKSKVSTWAKKNPDAVAAKDPRGNVMLLYADQLHRIAGSGKRRRKNAVETGEQIGRELARIREQNKGKLPR